MIEFYELSKDSYRAGEAAKLQEKIHRELIAVQKPRCHTCRKAGKDCTDSLACTLRVLKSLKPPVGVSLPKARTVSRWASAAQTRDRAMIEEYERAIAA